MEGYLREAARLPQAQRGVVHERVRAAARPVAALLSDLTPTFAGIVAAEAHGTEPAGGGQDQFTLALVGFLAELARAGHGLLLHLDDIQWIDSGTARVLASLADLLDDTPILVLTTARNDPDSIAATTEFVGSLGEAVGLDLELGPLDEVGVAELVAAMLPGLQAGHRLAQLVAVRSGGSPFVVQEYVRAIVDAGLLRPSWGSWVLDEDELDALELPQDALGLVLTRVAALGEQARQLLAIAAAIGSRFGPHLVAAVHGVGLDVVLDALLDAARHGLVQTRDDGEYAFVHDRIREALHDELDADAAAGLHRRIAEALEATAEPAGGHSAAHVYAVAHHHIAAGAPESTPESMDGEAARVFAACHAAGVLALANHAPADALAFLEHAAGVGEQLGSAALNGRFLLALGDALKQNGRYVEARERLEQALQVERDPGQRALVFTLLAEVHRSGWRTREAAEAVARGLAELGAAPPRRLIPLLITTLAMVVAGLVMQWTGWRFGSAKGEDRVRCTRIAGLHEVGGYIAVLNQRPHHLVLHMLRGLYWANRLGSGPAYARAHSGLGFLLGQLGLLRAAAREFARSDGDPSGSSPGVRALRAHYDGATRYLGFHDDGRSWVRVTEQHGQWLDLAAYADAVGAFLMEAVHQGRAELAAHWMQTFNRRLSLR
ncbi:MAG: hypothetical protein U0Q19_03675 [Kineosporiaceae bacterium]